MLHDMFVTDRDLTSAMERSFISAWNRICVHGGRMTAERMQPTAQDIDHGCSDYDSDLPNCTHHPIETDEPVEAGKVGE